MSFMVTGMRPLATVQNSVSLEANAMQNIEFHDKITRCRKYNQMVRKAMEQIDDTRLLKSKKVLEKSGTLPFMVS